MEKFIGDHESKVRDFIHYIDFFGNPDAWKKTVAVDEALAFGIYLCATNEISDFKSDQSKKAIQKKMKSIEDETERRVFEETFNFVRDDVFDLFHLECAFDRIKKDKREVNPFGIGSKRMNLVEFLSLGKQK